MTSRRIIASAVLLTLLPVVHANAAVKKKPVCKLITDNANDATGIGTTVPNGPYEANLDILSADIVTSATQITAVFRVAKVDSSPDSAGLGKAFDMVIYVGKETTPHTIHSVLGPNNQATWADGKGTGFVKTTVNPPEIHVTVSLADAGLSGAKLNTQLKNLQAQSFRWVSGAPVNGGRVDVATGTKPYLSQWPSCVKVGQ